ncbi:MAG: CBS domain-containing protein [Ardenticatenaceae bacterium]|nr:CBS domain-containing protein [Ardenticatenaceae bacterium]
MIKQTNISTVCETSPMGAMVIHYDQPLREAIHSFAHEHAMHSIFLVDDQNIFVGVINNRDLLDWARLQFSVYPRDYKMSVHHVRRLLKAEKIGELARAESAKMSVRLTDSIEEALRVMAEFDLEDIAVLHEDGRIANDLRLSEVLHFAVQVESADL